MAVIPVGVLIYLYIWPQLVRIWFGYPQPFFRIQQDTDGWASFITSDLLRAMPGFLFSIFTLFVCGILIVYFLGSRSFCYSVCPYGVFFGWAEKISPATRIVLTGGCENCGLCTLNCKSGVKVIQEIKQFGSVVDSNCLKSLDCVAGCPTEAIGLAFTTPSFFLKGVESPKPKKKTYDFTILEEFGFLILFLCLFVIYRGLYEIGVLLAGAISVMGGVGVIKGWKLIRVGRKHWLTYWIAIPFALLTLHSASIHYHAYQGSKGFEPNAFPYERVQHLQFVYDWGLFQSRTIEKQLAISYHAAGEINSAKKYFDQYLGKNVNDLEARVLYGKMLSQNGQDEKAKEQYLAAMVADTLLNSSSAKAWRATAHSYVAKYFTGLSDTSLALEHLQKAIADNPKDASHYCNYASLCFKIGDDQSAKNILLQGQAQLGSTACIQGLLKMIKE